MVDIKLHGLTNDSIYANLSKTKITDAIKGVDPTVTVPVNPTFEELSEAIGQISAGKKWASGTALPSNGLVTVNGLDFKPSLVYMGYSAYRGGVFSIFSEEHLNATNVSVATSVDSGVARDVKSKSSVNNGGFILGTEVVGLEIRWVAYE